MKKVYDGNSFIQKYHLRNDLTPNVVLFPSDPIDQSNGIVLTLAFLEAFNLLLVCQFLIWNLSIWLKVVVHGH